MTGVMTLQFQEEERLEERLLRQAMLNQEWKIRREMMMDIDTLETEQGQQHLDDYNVLEGMKRITIWTSTDWTEVEHRNMDIIMEDL
jgi:hypothetical protein